MTDLNIAEMKKLSDALLTDLTSLRPEVEYFEEWKAERAKHQANLASLKATCLEHAAKTSGHQGEIDDLVKRKAAAKSELDQVLGDLNSKRSQLESLDLLIKRHPAK